jgi:hypothetical protein
VDTTDHQVSFADVDYFVQNSGKIAVSVLTFLVEGLGRHDYSAS